MSHREPCPECGNLTRPYAATWAYDCYACGAEWASRWAPVPHQYRTPLTTERRSNVVSLASYRQTRAS